MAEGAAFGKTRGNPVTLICRGVLAALTLAVLLPGCTTHSLTLSEAHVTEVTPARGDGPRILAVVAHPDDETTFAGTLYKVTESLHGVCDLVVITNGEAGYRYSTLAEPYYGRRLTEEAEGRRWLPGIRGEELLESCRCLRVHELVVLGQKDQRYTLDPLEVLDPRTSGWDLDFLRRSLRERLAGGDYDFVLTLLPHADTHGHHQAAAVLALEAWSELPPEGRPVILAASSGEDRLGAAAGLPGFPLTALDGAPPLRFDRCQTFGYRNTLDYRVVVRWAIAAHKSQGTLQVLPVGCSESFLLYAANAADAAARAAALFAALAEP